MATRDVSDAGLTELERWFIDRGIPHFIADAIKMIMKEDFTPAKANKFLDANIRYKMGVQYLQLGQYKQPNSLEELSSTRYNDFISKSMTTNLFGVARRTGPRPTTSTARLTDSVPRSTTPAVITPRAARW